MTRLLAAIAGLALLGGCARQWAYDRPGVTEAERARDAEECRRSTTVPRVSRPFVFADGRLVEDEEARLEHEGPSDRDPLPLAARELVRIAVAGLGVEPDLPEGPLDQCALFGGRAEPMDAQPLPHDLPDRQAR